MTVTETGRRAGIASYDSFELTSLTPHLGAEVDGLDLAQPLDERQLLDLNQAFADWSVLVFRDQHLDREAHKAFGRYFGDLHVHPMNHARETDPELLIVKTTKDSPYTAGDAWHTDVTCDAVPPLASALYITETPEGGGGDTLYADMYLAYELLSPTLQSFLEGLTAVHDGGMPYVGSYGSTPPEGGYPRNEHPVVAVHPVTGRKVLREQRFHVAHQGIATMGEPGTARHAVCAHRHNAAPSLPCQVGAEHADTVGQPMHATSRCLGLLPPQPLRRACFGHRYGSTGARTGRLSQRVDMSMGSRTVCRRRNRVGHGTPQVAG